MRTCKELRNKLTDMCRKLQIYTLATNGFILKLKIRLKHIQSNWPELYEKLYMHLEQIVTNAQHCSILQALCSRFKENSQDRKFLYSSAQGYI